MQELYFECEIEDSDRPEELLAEGVFLLWGDLRRGKPWSLQCLFQPLGQQNWTVAVQCHQNFREMFR